MLQLHVKTFIRKIRSTHLAALPFARYVPAFLKARHKLFCLTPPRRLSSYDDGEENAAHPHMMICRLRRNACI